VEIQPKVKAVRFAQLEPGDLFLIKEDSALTFALKVIDAKNSGDKFALPLGPSFSQELHQPRLYLEPAATTISFGKDFIFQFSYKSDAWLVEEPVNQFYCAALLEDHVYLRANGHPYPGRYVECWIKLYSGMLYWGHLQGITAYSIKWEILLPQGNLPPRLLVEQSGKPFESR